MPKFSVSKNQVIAAPRADVFQEVRDFQKWSVWSPWIVAEPDCPLEFYDEGKSYRWDGQIIGSGEMTITGEQENEWITYDLRFLKPWKSEAKVKMTFTDQDGGTKVTWSLDSSLPFFMFFLKKMMVGLIGMDYARGLTRLKAVIEDGSVPAKLEVVGQTEVGGFSYLARHQTCSIDGIGESMEEEFEALKALGFEPTGPAFAIYHKWDFGKQEAAYEVGIPVAEVPLSVPDGFVTGEMPKLSVYGVRHDGPYDFVGDAWSTGVMHGRSKQFRQSRKVHPFEIYEQLPEEGKHPVTLVCFPIKG